MNIFVTGGTGFVGSTLAKSLSEKGHLVTILTRNPKKALSLPPNASFLQGDPTQPGPWQQHVPSHHVIINLAGASIFTRWNKKTKSQILQTRVLTTRNLVDGLRERKGKETQLLNASAIGYYGFHEDELLDESASPGNDFLARVCVEWEATARQAAAFDVRVTFCRFGIVLGRHGGALAKMLPLFHYYLGSPLGSGKQWFSWIHELDLARIFLFLIEHKEIEGPVNCSAPNPVRNREMTKILGKVLHKPTFMPPVPAFLPRLIMGEFGSVLLKGQRVAPQKLLDHDFRFQFPTLEQALEDILKS